MRNFAVTWEPEAAVDHVKARAFLGVICAARLDEELVEVREKLSALPEKGHPVKTRRKWAGMIKKVILSRSPYVLYCWLDLSAKRVTVIALVHERARPPKF